MHQNNQHLLQLVCAKENQEFQEIKKRFSGPPKYFFNVRRNITIVYDKPIVYIVHKQYLKIIDLCKNYIITDLVYNYKRNSLLFLTAEGQLFLHFASLKLQVEIKIEYKRVLTMEWLYAAQQYVSFFVAEESGIHLYRIQQQKKGAKEVKHISGRYHCYLYEPLSEFLAGFQYGNCDVAYIVHFVPQKEKNWFRSGEVEVCFTDDEMMAQRIKLKKRLGLQGNRIGKEIFGVKQNENYLIDIQNVNNTPYMFFYYANQGKLQLTPLSEVSEKKQVIIKLPSDSPPSFNIFDNMLTVHLQNEKITFIYDINPIGFQALVSPYTITHENQQLNSLVYSSQFLSKRSLLPNGQISKWKINLSVIYCYLKNQMQVFDFLSRRSSSKIQTIKWMRENIFNFKQINLSKMWKAIFSKISSCLYDESQIISMIEIYSNLFYTLSIEPQVNRAALANILIECLRQANQYQIIIPNELQILATQFLLSTQKYELLAFLCHNNIIKDDPKIFSMIYQKGEQQDQDQLVTLSIDLAFQYATPKQVLRLILKSQRLKQGKRYIKSNFEKMQPLDVLESTKYIKNIDAKRQFFSYLRSFIDYNFPTMNKSIISQAEKTLFD